LSKAELSYQKLRGGYYTPEPIARFLSDWAVQTPDDRILEPSCGDGVLMEASLRSLLAKGASRKKVALQVQGVEADESERQKALKRISAQGFSSQAVRIHSGDFFSWCQSLFLSEGLLGLCEVPPEKFDVVIGNPPFIRYQNFLEAHRKPAFEMMFRAGLKPNRLTNAWVPFVVAASFALSEKGRLAMVLPAELLQVNYAAELRCFLSNFFNKITLITFRKLVFADIQQEVVLLLAERNGGGAGGIRTVELNGIDDLPTWQYSDFTRRELKPLDHSTEKWTQYFLDKKEIGLLRELKNHPLMISAGDLMEVDVGVVTGENKFFVLNYEQIERLSLQKYVRRIVSRSAHLRGIDFSDAEWNFNRSQDYPSYLLDLSEVGFDELSQELHCYISAGERADYHSGFKCRIRKRWYVVPSIWVPDAFMLRQIHDYPKLVFNRACATCTDTIHRVRFRQGVNGNLVSASFLNSLTFAFAEVVGRSYGGGVLELEPNEAEKLLLPRKMAKNLPPKEIHSLLLKDGIDTVLAITDRMLLIEEAGLSLKEAQMLRQIWQKLKNRRIGRKHTARRKTETAEVKPARKGKAMISAVTL
jgi:adenine-specific DNA methylase